MNNSRSQASKSSANNEWLKKYSNNYRGNWVALYDGILLDSNISREDLMRDLREADILKDSFLVWIDWR